MNPESGAEEAKPPGVAGGAEVAANPGELDEYLRSLLALPPVKPWSEPVDGARLLDELVEATGDLKAKCLRFVLDHANAIAAAEPALPQELNDRAADIWEPLLVIAATQRGAGQRL